MPHAVGQPRTAGDERVLAVLHRLAAGNLSVDDALGVLLDLSAEPGLDGETFAAAIHIAAEATTDGEPLEARDDLLALLVSSGELVLRMSAATNQPIEELSFTERSQTITTVVRAPALSAP